MGRRMIMQIRLSKNWVKHSPEPVQMLAFFMYAIYTFLGLNDPASGVHWAVGSDTTSESPILIISEVFPETDDEEESESEEPMFRPNPDSDSSDQILNETDLNPDLED